MGFYCLVIIFYTLLNWLLVVILILIWVRGFPLAHLGRGPRSPSAHSSEFLAFPRIIPSCRRVRKFSRFFSPPLDVYPCKRAICRLLPGFPVLFQKPIVPFQSRFQALASPLLAHCNPCVAKSSRFFSPPRRFYHLPFIFFWLFVLLPMIRSSSRVRRKPQKVNECELSPKNSTKNPAPAKIKATKNRKDPIKIGH